MLGLEIIRRKETNFKSFDLIIRFDNQEDVDKFLEEIQKTKLSEIAVEINNELDRQITED